jgi:hypothetical protein
MWFENEIVCSKNYQIALIWDTKIAINTNIINKRKTQSKKFSYVPTALVPVKILRN